MEDSVTNKILTVLIATLVMGVMAGCGVGSAPAVLIEYRRSGGFAGFNDHLVIDTSGHARLTRQTEETEFTLDIDQLNLLESLFDAADFASLDGEYLPDNPGADLFEYEVGYRGQVVRTADGAVPPALEPVIEALNNIVGQQ